MQESELCYKMLLNIFNCLQGMLQSYLKIPLDQVVESGMQDERDNKSKNLLPYSH